MAKKLITNGIDSSVLVKNLNSEYINGLSLNEIRDRATANYQKQFIYFAPYELNTNHLYSIHIWGNSYFSSNIPVDTYIQLSVIARDITDLNKQPEITCQGILHNGFAIKDIKFFVYNNYLCLHYTLPQPNPTLYIKCYKDGVPKNTIVNVTDKDIPEEGVYFLRTLANETVSAKNNTGKTFDIVDLPSNVSTLDLSTLPPIANVESIILRYNGVVKNVENYMASAPVTLDSLIEQGLVEDSVTNEDLVALEILSEEDLEKTPVSIPKDKLPVLSDIINENNQLLYENEEIRPLVNLDEYVKTPNNWLKIYVPTNYLNAYISEYPSLERYFESITLDRYNSIGGVNLFSYKNCTITPGSNIIDRKERIIKIKSYTNSSKSENKIVRIYPGRTYDYACDFTISGFIKADIPTKLYGVVGGASYENPDLVKIPNIEVTTEYKRFVFTTRNVTFRLDSGTLGSFFDFWVTPENFIENNVVYIKDIKVERGTYATDWCLSPEDIEQEFDYLREEVEETYAKKDGAYEGLLAGTAMNLQGQQDVTISSMYQPTGGNLDVNWETAEIQNIKGNSIAWNQFVKDGDREVSNVVGVTGRYNNYTLTQQGIPNRETYYILNLPEVRHRVIKGHKYLFRINKITRTEANDILQFSVYDDLTESNDVSTATGVGKLGENNSIIFNAPKNGDFAMILGVKIDKEINVTYEGINLFDLTLIYGKDNEPTTPEQFEEDYQKWFGKRLTYEEYDDGSIRDAKATELKTVGFNLYTNSDFEGNASEWQKRGIAWKNNCNYKGQIEIKYNFKGVTTGSEATNSGFDIAYTDGSIEKCRDNVKEGLNVIKSKQDKVVDYIIHNISTNGNITISNICINFSWSGTRNGEYEEHWEETKSLPITTFKGKLNGEGESVVVFPDGLRSARNVYDEIYIENGVTKAIKRIGSVDLGNLTWNYDYTYSRMTSSTKTGIVSSIAWNYDYILSKLYGTAFGIYGKGMYYTIEETNPEIFRESVQGSILYFELAEPEVYVLDDFALPLVYRIDDFGTEQIIAPENTITPILTTRYGVNAVDTLRRLPQNYISERSINNLLYQLNSVMNGTWSKSWNNTSNSYDFSFIPNEVPDSSLPNEELP